MYDMNDMCHMYDMNTYISNIGKDSNHKYLYKTKDFTWRIQTRLLWKYSFYNKFGAGSTTTEGSKIINLFAKVWKYFLKKNSD